jgi:hypothetical protein
MPVSDLVGWRYGDQRRGSKCATDRRADIAPPSIIPRLIATRFAGGGGRTVWMERIDWLGRSGRSVMTLPILTTNDRSPQVVIHMKPVSSDSGLARMAARWPRAEALAAAMMMRTYYEHRSSVESRCDARVCRVKAGLGRGPSSGGAQRMLSRVRRWQSAAPGVPQ